jgi:hypothetical protein
MEERGRFGKVVQTIKCVPSPSKKHEGEREYIRKCYKIYQCVPSPPFFSMEEREREKRSTLITF